MGWLWTATSEKVEETCIRRKDRGRSQLSSFFGYDSNGMFGTSAYRFQQGHRGDGGHAAQILERRPVLDVVERIS